MPGGGLRAHESRGGHTLSKHVGWSDDALRQRLRKGLDVASTFTSRALAEDAVSAALLVNRGKIGVILPRLAAGERLIIEQKFNRAIGRSIQRGADGAVNARRVRIVIERDGSHLGYRIVSAFPIP